MLAAWLVLDGATAEVVGSGYGRLLAGKPAALVALGVLGRNHRRRTLPALNAGGPGAFRRFTLIEAGVMMATVALAVALSAAPRGHVRSRPRGAATDDQRRTDRTSDRTPR